MLNLTNGVTRDCERVSRRRFLQIGGLSALGFALPDLLRVQASVKDRKNVNCILMWMHGGPSHIDTFDPKPDAPAEIKGEFGVCDTTLPGVKITEHLPMLARTTDKYSILRSVNPQQGSHGLADHIMMSGHKFNPSVTFPTFGSVIAKERGYQNDIFPFVQLNQNMDRRFNGGLGGFLGDQFNAFEVGDNPSSPKFRVRDLSLTRTMNQSRLERRQGMLSELERYQHEVEATASSEVRSRDVYYQKAFNLITSPVAKKAFDLNREDPRVRDRYGRHKFGQSCLLARRLIEAGVHFVTVTDGGWDTHTGNFYSLKKNRLPPVDQGYSALLQDLSQRGMLDNTLVVWMGDFGRTPKVNPSAGRDHWASTSVVCMGGGGVKTGQVVGRTNALAEFIVDSPLTPQDVAATIYHCLGVPLDTWYRSPDGRPIPLVPEGKPIKQLL